MAAEGRKRLAIVIVNYRTAQLVEQCLESLADQVDPARDAVVVVDNASGDGSPETIERTVAERGWIEWARVIRSPVNGGFSAGNNVGVQAVESDAYLLLNSDTIVRPGALPILLDALDSHPEIDLMAPRLEWPDGAPQESVFRYHTAASEFIKAACTGPITRLLGRYEVALRVQEGPVEFKWASFACILIRRTVFDRIGLMDEGYFMYYEDVDFCRRAREAGLRSLHWPSARVVHLRGGTSPVKELTAARKRRPAYYYESRNRYIAKFYGIPGLWAANLCWWAGRCVSLAREIIGRKKPHVCEYEGRDIWINAFRPLRTGPTPKGPSS